MTLYHFVWTIVDCIITNIDKMVRVTARHDCTVVMVGDNKVGKSALAAKFRSGKFEAGYTRTSFETLSTSSIVDGKRIKYTIYDTAGSRGANTTREIAYREADVFLLCYKISDPSTLFSAINHWVPELRLHAPATPVILVGCQTDLRKDRATLNALAKQGRSPVSADQARSFSQQAEAIGYVELSAKTSTKGPESVFELAAKISLEQVKESYPGLPKPISTSTPEHTLDREYSTDSAEHFWEQFQSPALPRATSSASSVAARSSASLSSFHRNASLSSSVSSSLNSTRSSTLSIPRSPVRNRRNSMSLRAKPAAVAEKMIKIKCQRLTVDKIYEEVEIEVPAPIYETLQACNESPSLEAKRKESLGSKLKNLFIRD